MRKYILIFSGTYLLAIAAFLIISEIMDVSGSASLAILAVAAVVAGMAFVNNERRAPTKTEKRALVWGSYLAALFVSGALVSGYLMLSQDGPAIVSELRQVQLWIWIIAAAVITLVSVAILSLCYGWVAGKYAAQRAKSGT